MCWISVYAKSDSLLALYYGYLEPKRSKRISFQFIYFIVILFNCVVPLLWCHPYTYTAAFLYECGRGINVMPSHPYSYGNWLCSGHRRFVIWPKSLKSQHAYNLILHTYASLIYTWNIFLGFLRLALRLISTWHQARF